MVLNKWYKKMDQRELLEAYQTQKSELKKQRAAKTDAAKAAKAAEEYIKKVKTEVSNVKKDL